MKIDEKIILEIADLAQLEIAADAMADNVASITRILELVNQMQSVDTEDVRPLANPLDATQRLRPDAVTETDEREKYQRVAPATEAGLYLVPRVVE